MKLYDIPQQSKLYGLNPNGDEDGWVIFGHLDGMYSFCTAYDGKGEYLGICHLVGFTPLEEFEDGYRVVESDEHITPP